MKTALTYAPQPPARRHRALPLEPFVFAVLLMVLTLGINKFVADADANVDSAHKAEQVEPAKQAEPAQSALTAQIARLN